MQERSRFTFENNKNKQKSKVYQSAKINTATEIYQNQRDTVVKCSSSVVNAKEGQGTYGYYFSQGNHC